MDERRIALLVGVSKYQFANPLSNPVNDIKSMESVLKRLDFEIILLENPTLKTLRLTLNEFGKRLNEYEIGLFYFAGHGIQIKGANYLVPVDANPLSENQVEYDCVNANLILSIMEDAKNETNFIFLDACRNNPFERAWNRSSTIAGLSYMSAPYGTLIAYSTAPDKTALDGNINTNSPYTKALIDEILAPDLTILQVLQNVRSKLIKLTNGEQVPWESTSLLGDVVFNNNRYFSLDTFCQKVIYTKEVDVVLNQLNLSTFDLVRITKNGISINKEDREAGVIEVYYKDKVNYFDVFDKLEIQILRDGEREYNLFTQTKKSDDVIFISQQLYNRLGGGLYDDNRHHSFKETDKIRAISRGKLKGSKAWCFTNWYFKTINFSLYYLSTPPRQFIFKICVKPNKTVIKNTLKDILHFNYIELSKKRIELIEGKTENGRFVDYLLPIDGLELNFFNTARVRTFYPSKGERISSNMTLNHDSLQSVDIKSLNMIVNDITSIYGMDTNQEGYLTGEEIEDLRNDRYWSGRMWDLNLQHQIRDSESGIEDMLYGVHLSYFKEDGLELTIFGLEDLLNYEA